MTDQWNYHAFHHEDACRRRAYSKRANINLCRPIDYLLHNISFIIWLAKGDAQVGAVLRTDRLHSLI